MHLVCVTQALTLSSKCPIIQFFQFCVQYPFVRWVFFPYFYRKWKKNVYLHQIIGVEYALKIHS